MPANLIDRLQQVLRDAARSQYQAIAAPPFTIFINPHDLLPYQNYAIPDAPVAGDPHVALAHLKSIFAARARRARFEFIAEYAPELPAILRAAGFVEEGRYPLLTCTAAELREPPSPAGLSINTLDAAAPDAAIHETLTINDRGFNIASNSAFIAEDIARFRKMITTGRAFSAYIDGEPVAGGMFTAPRDGLCELVGITTLPEWRGRGIAAALTAFMTRTAFALGVEIAFLSAADEQATRVYERVGYRRCAAMLAYIAPPFG
jgi:GNAT superfamily N-acetyltransferase